MITRNLPLVLTWDHHSSPAPPPLLAHSLDFSGQKQSLCLLPWRAGNLLLTAGKQELWLLHMQSDHIFYLTVMLFWSSSPQRTRKNQSSRTLLLDKGFCSWFLKRSKTSLQRQMNATGTAWKTYGICRYQVAARMYRISACIYSKLRNRAACNTNQSRCRESQKKLSGKGKRVEIKAFICIYID